MGITYNPESEILNYQLSEFQEDLDNYIKKIAVVTNSKELESFISNDFKNLMSLFISLGEIMSKESSNPKDIFLANYSLPNDFKTVSILHRDVLLELSKASISKQEGLLNDKQIENHFTSSKTVLEKKLNDFVQFINTEKNKISNNKKAIDKISSKITLQKNPWDIYKSQYETIRSQINEINNQKVLAFKSITIFDALKTVVSNIIDKHNILVTKIAKNINTIQTRTNDGHEGLLLMVDEFLSQQSIIENKSASFSEIINTHINQLEKIQIPITSIDGELFIRDVDLKKRTQKWFDYQVLPEFMDLLGLETNLINKYSLNLMNLNNSLQLSKDKHENISLNSIINTLSHLKDDINDIENRGESISESLKDKVLNELLISNLIKGKPFLDVTLNSSFNVESNTLVKNIKAKLQKSSLYFNSQYQKSINFKSLSNIEVSTQCIVHRMFQDESSHYDSLFLNKKFIGDLFLVPRKTQEAKLERIVDHWNQGFNKSVLVSGNRLSGRSTFLDYSAKKFFGKNIVILTPNSDAIIDGRKFKTTTDLKEALSYVKNNNIKSTRPVILIDDLELWRDSKHNLIYNIRALINFIETESDDAFVMASTTDMMVNHLNKRLHFSNTFSHTISVNDTDKDEITNAILLRHGAAHRELVSEKLELISDSKVRKLALKLVKQNDYNFGQTLQSWTFNTFVQDNEKILFKESFYEFLDFFTAQEIIILKQASIFTYVSEYSIKNLTTSSFETDFKSALRRLMNVKVLLRGIDGKLYINPVVVNDVTRIINNKVSI